MKEGQGLAYKIARNNGSLFEQLFHFFVSKIKNKVGNGCVWEDVNQLNQLCLHLYNDSFSRQIAQIHIVERLGYQ